MRTSPKLLVSVVALGIIAAGAAAICARGLRFSDPATPLAAPVALQQPSAPNPDTAVAALPPAPAPSLPEQDRAAAETAGKFLDGFMTAPRPDGSRSVQIPEITPDQADAAARAATDVINGLLANSGERRLGATPQVNPDDAAAMAQSAAKMLNGFLRDNRLADEERPHRRTR